MKLEVHADRLLYLLPQGGSKVAGTAGKIIVVFTVSFVVVKDLFFAVIRRFADPDSRPLLRRQVQAEKSAGYE